MIYTLLWLTTAITLIVVGVLLIYSPGKVNPYLDEYGTKIEGSISEKIFVTIGGVQQGMIIKSKSSQNPVLLYLHGGMPDYFLTQRYPTGLDDIFTVVWWDQRGSGLSYNPKITKESISLEQLLSDIAEIANYLRARFGQEKIYLLGRSGGSFLGIQAAAKMPWLYHAYIGIGQMSDQLQSEKLAFEYILKEYRAQGNRKMVQKLESSPILDDLPRPYLKIRDAAMHSMGIGTTRDMKSVASGMFFPSLMFREYTLKEKYKLWRAKARWGIHPLWERIKNTDLSGEIRELNIPVYFLHGRYDHTVSYSLTKSYFEELHAPVKGFYTFEHSAHSPHFEEPERVREIIEKDILQGKTLLADK